MTTEPATFHQRVSRKEWAEGFNAAAGFLTFATSLPGGGEGRAFVLGLIKGMKRADATRLSVRVETPSGVIETVVIEIID